MAVDIEFMPIKNSILTYLTLLQTIRKLHELSFKRYEITFSRESIIVFRQGSVIMVNGFKKIRENIIQFV